MKLAFVDGKVDRRADLREVQEQLHAIWPTSRVLPMWQGKPMMMAATEGPRALAFQNGDHPALSSRRDQAVFLGEAAGQFHFAVDLSDWIPETDTDEVGNFVDRSEQGHPDMPRDTAFAELRANMSRLSGTDAELAATAKAILGWQVSHRFCARCGVESHMAMAGWRRDCPDCGGQHFPRTDPVVIMLVTHGNAVLLGRSPGWPERMHSLLAGFVEPGETLEAAVRREVLEETGVRVGKVDYCASQPWPFPSSLMIGCHAEALSTELTVDPNELEAARWVSREMLLDIVAGVRDDIKLARSGAIAGHLLENWLADRDASRN